MIGCGLTKKPKMRMKQCEGCLDCFILLILNRLLCVSTLKYIDFFKRLMYNILWDGSAISLIKYEEKEVA